MSVKVSYKSNYGIQGSYDVPLDKSIAQRSAILGLSTNTGVEGEDIVSTKKAAKQIRSGADNLCLDMGNSGTGMRLMAGFIAGLGIDAELVGDESLSNRPMERIAKPLREMGAEIHLKEGKPPIKIAKSNIADEFIYDLEIPSAQIKSCLLLAALSAGTKIKIIENQTTRNHTELLLQYLDANLAVKKSNGVTEIILDATKPITAKDVFVPGDFSSAAFLIGAALISKDADICIKNVGINPTRIGFLEVLKEMNANIKIDNVREANNEQIGDIYVKYSSLKSVIVAKDIIPNIIDELPLLSVLACFAEGETKVSGAKELRVKESDRLSAIELMLKNIGVEFDVFEDGFNIIGKGANYQFSSGNFVSLGDHRIAMCSALCALKATENIFIDNVQSVTTSFPNFFEILEQMGFTIEEA